MLNLPAPFRGFLARTKASLAWPGPMLWALLLVYCVKPTIVPLEGLEILVLATGLACVQGAWRGPYLDATRRWPWLASMAALGGVLLATTWGAPPPTPLHFLSTCLLLFVGMPLVRSGRSLALLGFLGTGVAVVADLIPLSIHQLEHCQLSKGISEAIFQSNWAEAREYLSVHPLVLPLAPYVAGALSFALASRYVGSWVPRRRMAYLFLALLLVNLDTSQASMIPEHYHGYRLITSRWKELASSRALGEATFKFTAKAAARPRKILIILGEATTRKHMSLYGYDQPTTPCLEGLRNAGGLFVFRDVISPDCTTSTSLVKVLTTSTNEHPVPFESSPSILDLYRRAGFQTTWLSNQNRMELFAGPVAVLAATADHTLYANHHLGNRLDSEPDEVMLPLLDKVLAAQPGNALVICHLMGAHVNYNSRVPHHFQEEQRRLGPRLRPYDLAIRYGDHLLAEIIERARSAGFDTVLFLSDHGEVPHQGIAHNPAHYLPEMVEIPFCVWLAPGLIQDQPALVRGLRAALDRPFMTDGLIHTLIDLSGIKSSLYDPSHSVLAPDFKARPRLILDNTVHYLPSTGPHGAPDP